MAKAQTSYLGIPGSTDKSYSGDLFAPLSPVAQTSSGAITTSLTPFMLQFYSRTATQDGSGYDITWVQTPCN